MKKERCHEPYYAHNTAVSSTYSVVPQLFLILPFILVLLIYIHAVCISNRHQKKWPFYRSLLWFLGVFLAMTAVAGPLGSRAHMDFSFHMISRLLLGMLAPLLMAAAAPIALLLCTLNTALARRLSLILRSWPLRIITHPIVTSLLNVGGLWVLYKTRLYSLTNESMLIHIFEWDLFLSNKCPQHIKPTKYTFCGFFL
ncbi:cytochrome c oxidase assembly protein [Peribacillus kribbensis]|uniref:cytochrome c oxidase assembly protein n=1 Tax=Peribacillus kribbensis TaxID=356658 RepID=UPI001471FBFE